MAISIGIPFYNAEKFLADAIRSVFAQTYQDWELILVDDGSVDGSLEIAQSIKDSRVRVISDGVNKKLPARLNQIVNESKYDLVARMDADDMLSPYRFERQLPCFEDADVQIVSTGMGLYSDDSSYFGYQGCDKHQLTTLDFFRARSISHATILARTEWFRKNPYDSNAIRIEDTELFCRARSEGVLSNNNIFFIDEPLYFYRQDNTRVSCRALVESYQRRKDIIRRYGPVSLGSICSMKELLRYDLRSFFVRGISFLGMLDRVAKQQQGKVIPAELCVRMKKEIDQVKNTRVPGLD